MVHRAHDTGEKEAAAAAKGGGGGGGEKTRIAYSKSMYAYN